MASNEVRHFNLFKYLYENNNVRYFIKEYDFDIGFYINKYVQTGNKEWLKFRIPSKEAQELYDQLFEFNKGLPTDKKIIFLSVDAYPFTSTEKFVANLILDKGIQSQPVKEAIDILKTVKRTDSKGFGMDIRGKDKDEILRKLDAVRMMVLSNNQAFKDYFGQDYVFFHLLVFNYGF